MLETVAAGTLSVLIRPDVMTFHVAPHEGGVTISLGLATAPKAKRPTLPSRAEWNVVSPGCSPAANNLLN